MEIWNLNNNYTQQCIKNIGQFVLNRKVCEYLESPLNIKFGVYSRKDKSKILYLAK
jgi:hypothetical protein